MPHGDQQEDPVGNVLGCLSSKLTLGVLDGLGFIETDDEIGGLVRIFGSAKYFVFVLPLAPQSN